MAELIDKWEVVNKLIQLENQYNFYKNVWDADVLYRRIAELEIGIGKTPGLEVVRCKDCKHRGDYGCPMYHEEYIEWDDDGYHESEIVEHDRTRDDGFCDLGERKDNERKAD